MVEAFKPASLQEALEIRERVECTVFAGGTDLMVKKKRWSGLEPSFDSPVLFISDLREIRNINIAGDSLEIGSACTCAELASSSLVPGYMRKMFSEMASPGIRNIATLGGNICNSSPAGDSLPVLYASDAELILESSRGKREIPIERFITGPGKNILEKDEILTQIRIPLKEFTHGLYRKVGTRKSTALSKLSFIGLAEVMDGRILDIRIAFGAVAPTVVRSRELESKLIHLCMPSDENIKEILKSYGEIVKPIDDQRSTAVYRRTVSLRLLKDFLLSSRR